MMNNPISKIDKGLSLTEKTEQQLVEAIRQKIFLPGDKLLGEIELAENFGVSRTVLREALHRLVGRGILEARRGSGFYVATDQFSPVTDSLYHLLEIKCGGAGLLNIVDVRLVVEPEIARLAALNRTDEELKSLTDCYARMEAQINNPENMVRFDIDFHRLIAKATNNPILPVMMEPIFQLMFKFVSQTYNYPHSPLLALKSHSNIISALEKEDGERAFNAMGKHMLEAKEHAQYLKKNEPGSSEI